MYQQIDKQYVEYCPVCENIGRGQALFLAKDYLVSELMFPVVRCRLCGMVYTQNIPTATEISKFYRSEAYLSHAPVATTMMARLYMLVRKYMLWRKVRKLGRLIKPGADILDIGAGTGSFIRAMEKKGYRVTGVEPDEEAANIARKRKPAHYPGTFRKVKNNQTEEQQDVMQSGENNHPPINHGSLITGNRSGRTIYPDTSFLGENDQGRFAMVTMWHVLEHMRHPKKELSLCYRILGDDGLLVVAVPVIGSFDAHYYKEYWAALDVPRHMLHFDQDTIRKLLNDCGFRIRQSWPLPFDAFYISMLSEKYKGSLPKSLALMRAMLVALLSNTLACLRLRPPSSQVFICSKSGRPVATDC